MKDHLGALIDDLVGSYTNNREDEYFCGSIVIAENQKDKRWDVVDGQQRLTSFIILACTILRGGGTFLSQIKTIPLIQAGGHEEAFGLSFAKEDFKKVIKSLQAL
ncbi:hypothetical protein HMPREF1423_00110 [Helicobacter pylori GAM270ASi]|nr:hypothetical protein HMPREF1423_00110 [Helicobacter pylori GAM270ASi]